VTGSDPYSIHVLGAPEWNPAADNVDVEVRFADGRRYGATFFTLGNLERLFEKNRRTGECAGGLYLWAANMIVVDDLSAGTISRTVADLIEQREFDKAFIALHEA
jgi:hypothetical protein